MAKAKRSQGAKLPAVFQSASIVAANVELEGIRLLTAGCHVGEIHPDHPPGQLSQKLESYIRHDSEDKVLLILLRYMLTATRDEPAQKKDKPLEVQAAFELRYSTNDTPFVDGQLHAFARTVAAFTGWPYWREFVQSMTVRMGLPALTLPLLKQDELLPAEEPKAQPKKARQKRRG